MPFILLSALLFGLVHPGSKFFISAGLDLLSFCELYILFRLLLQIPVMLVSKKFELPTRKQLLLMISIGILGGALQLSEFSGIASGVPVAVVTFLVYTHPVWTLVLSRVINQEELNLESVVRLLIGFTGLVFISRSQWSQHTYPLVALVPALTSGLIIALWVTLSNKAKKEGLSTWSISFYYDLIAFMSLGAFAIIRGQHVLSDFSWLLDAAHVAKMIFYALFIGLLPNLLFYHGSLKTPARSAGLALLLEPLVASLTAWWVRGDRLSSWFICGAILILLTGVPMTFFKKFRLSSITFFAIATLGLALNFVSTACAKSDDPPATHGMLVFGDREIYFSHLPMFHNPHDYQVIMKIELPARPQAVYFADAKTHPHEIYTFVPKPMVLPDIIAQKINFAGDLYRGHFEQGGTILLHDVEAKISNVIMFRKFAPAASHPPQLQYVFFGQTRDHNGEGWAAHVIAHAPDFDHILKITTAAAVPEGEIVDFTGVENQKRLPSDNLVTGQSEGRVIPISTGQSKYLEYDDLN